MSTGHVIAEASVDPGSEIVDRPVVVAAEPSTEAAPSSRRPRSILLWLCVGWITVLLLAALFADLLPLPAYGRPAGDARTPPLEHWGNGLLLGTDAFGRSNLSRVVYGARASMMIGMLATLIGLLVGGFVGLLSGYGRGWADRGSSFVVDTLLAFPPLVLLLTLTAVLTPKMSTLLIGLSVLVVPTFVRLERAAAMAWSERPFVLAARSYGSRDMRVALRHVLPNSALTVITYVPTVVSGMIVAEGSLSFLGLGLPSPTPSWGGMIAEGKSSLRTEPSVVFVPAAFVFVTVLALNVLGEQVRSRYESRER